MADPDDIYLAVFAVINDDLRVLCYFDGNKTLKMTYEHCSKVVHTKMKADMKKELSKYINGKILARL